MPYIKQELRDELEYPLDVITGSLNCMFADKDINKAGVLNYVITVLIDNAYGPLSDAKYKDYNEAIGMLECCKLEFYRKAAAPYEDLKERENGSVLDGKRVDGIKLRLNLEESINDITGEDVKRVWDKVVENKNATN